MPQTSGLVARKNFIAGEHATCVTRLLKSGAIPLGFTNVSELCMWMETNNSVYGRTNNPYNKNHIVGGSSGGEGAIIGSGASPFGLGSDIGGSVRGPAFFNGIFGHKPTGGLIPNTGQYPMDGAKHLTTGPLARKAEDLWPLVKILAGPDSQDEFCKPFELGDPYEVNLKDLTVISVADNGVLKVDRDLQEAQNRCASFLSSKGAAVRKTEIEGFRYSFEIWAALISSATKTSFKTLMGNGVAINPFYEFLKWIFGISSHTFPAIGLAVLEYLPSVFGSKAKYFIEYGKNLRSELISLLGKNGIILYPPYVSAAPVHNKPLFPPFNWIYTAIFNALEFPATEVPLGLNDEGLPLGVQVASIPGNDHVTIAVAMELEKAFGGWIFPG
jgi:fatty acid amide hydrolase 2